MVDFTTATATYSAKRLYEPIDDFDDFCDIKGTFLNNTSMNLLEKELKSESYTAVINFSKGGEVKATARLSAKDETGFASLLEAIADNDIAVDAYGTGATAAENPDKRNWKLVFKGTTSTSDPFTFTVDESYAELDGYHEAATCTTIDAWADEVTALSTAPTA